MIRELISDLARPVMCRMPYRRLSVVAAVTGKAAMDARWRNARRRYREFYDPVFRARFRADLADVSGRSHYYSGVFYDQSQRLLAERFLAGHECTYIDVGANNGLQTVAVARAAGPQCRIVSIEPNPASYELLRTNLKLNGLNAVETYNVGLSDAAGELELSGVGGHTGTDTLRPVPGATRTHRVPVLRGDDLLSGFVPNGRLLVKVDTEGFEHRALQGMSKLLAYEPTAVCVEITPAWLTETGSSAQALFDDLFALGMKAWQMFEDERFGRVTLRLVPIDGPVPDAQYNALFARQAFSDRLTR